MLRRAHHSDWSKLLTLRYYYTTRRVFLNRYLLSDPDLPPLKWSSLKYYFRMEDEIDGKEEEYS